MAAGKKVGYDSCQGWGRLVSMEWLPWGESDITPPLYFSFNAPEWPTIDFLDVVIGMAGMNKRDGSLTTQPPLTWPYTNICVTRGKVAVYMIYVDPVLLCIASLASRRRSGAEEELASSVAVSLFPI